jgi:hypothetical protein
MIAGKYTKQPSELLPLSIDFVYELIRDDDTVVSQSVTATNVDTDADVGADLLEGTAVLGDSLVLDAQGVTMRANTRVIQRVKAGLDGDRYLLTFRVVTTLGYRWEGDIYLVVMEP